LHDKIRLPSDCTLYDLKNIEFYEKEGVILIYKQNKKPDSPDNNSDSIFNEYKRNKKKGAADSGVTGRGSTEYDNMNFKRQRVNRIVSILTQFSLILGFLVFLILWLL